MQCYNLTLAKGLNNKKDNSPWGHLQQAEWWGILGPAWGTAHNLPSQCHRTITQGLTRPAAPSRPPPLPHEANHVIWCNDRVMTQIGGVFSFPLLKATEEMVNTLRMPESEPELSHLRASHRRYLCTLTSEIKINGAAEEFFDVLE